MIGHHHMQPVGFDEQSARRNGSFSPARLHEGECNPLIGCGFLERLTDGRYEKYDLFRGKQGTGGLRTVH